MEYIGAARALPNPRPDIAFVIGIEDAVTSAAERLCREFGMRVHYAMKRDRPNERITSTEEEAVIVPDLGPVDNVLVVGLRASDRLEESAGGGMDCNWKDDDASAFAYPLACVLHAATSGDVSLPDGWVLKDIPPHPSRLEQQDARWQQQWLEAQCAGFPVAHFGPAGTVVANFGRGKQLLLIPQAYSEVFRRLEHRWMF
ncbi:hypothetical protein [Rubrivivax gelatinosus]|nr:hypothetical protein [Rubrivivax gelatinosus]MBG6083194.1 hypothetical protein [Rubrivivax gelatinosus]